MGLEEGSNTSAEPVELALKARFCVVVTELTVVATEIGSLR